MTEGLACLLQPHEQVVPPIAIYEIHPAHVSHPETENACVEVVRWAASEGIALVPVGGATRLEQGEPLRNARWAAVLTSEPTSGGNSTRGDLALIHEFSAADMVVTAGAGVKLSVLQQTLASSGQFLPVDAPHSERATLGGIVATNTQGLWRPAFGSPRDRLLGVRVVLADATIVRGGGKVVKNVAGYDLCKLFAGSWGTLGLITEVTFKTAPLPHARRHVVFEAPSPEQAASAALRIHAAHLQPAYLTVIAQSEQPAALCVGLLGGEKTVSWQAEQITQILQAADLRLTDEGPSEHDLRHAIAASPSAAKALISARPSDIPSLLGRLAPHASLLVGHVPTGLVEIALPDAQTGGPVADMRSRLDRVYTTSRECQTTLQWTRLPLDCAGAVRAWGPTRDDFGLMQRIKATLDPGGLFSPGRFVGRL